MQIRVFSGNQEKAPPSRMNIKEVVFDMILHAENHFPPGDRIKSSFYLSFKQYRSPGFFYMKKPHQWTNPSMRLCIVALTDPDGFVALAARMKKTCCQDHFTFRFA